jgi:hypothetical protein
MRRWAVVLSAISVSLGAATAVAGTASAGNDNDPYTLSNGHAQAGPKGGVVPAQDANAARPSGGGGKNLLYHGGVVRSATTTVQPIYWGNSWSSADGKISELATLYGGLTLSNGYAHTNAEYYDTVNGTHAVSPGMAYSQRIMDPSQAVTGDPTTQQIVDEVLRATGGNIVPGGYYPVYVDSKRGNVGYCAWHSYGTTADGKTEFQIGFFFNLDNDSGCSPQDTASGHSEGVAALANVTGHEYSEMVTDPQLGAWWDQQGNENADKCAWTFGSQLLSIGGENWKIQGNWSNAAFNANRGYGTGRKKVVGCIDGTNA